MVPRHTPATDNQNYTPKQALTIHPVNIFKIKILCWPILKKFDSTTSFQTNLSILGSGLLTAYARAECIHEISCNLCGYLFWSSSFFNDKNVFLLGVIFLLYGILPLAFFFSLFLSCFCVFETGFH